MFAAGTRGEQLEPVFLRFMTALLERRWLTHLAQLPFRSVSKLLSSCPTPSAVVRQLVAGFQAACDSQDPIG
jgi:hypothetical protein